MKNLVETKTKGILFPTNYVREGAKKFFSDNRSVLDAGYNESVFNVTVFKSFLEAINSLNNKFLSDMTVRIAYRTIKNIPETQEIGLSLEEIKKFLLEYVPEDITIISKIATEILKTLPGIDQDAKNLLQKMERSIPEPFQIFSDNYLRGKDIIKANSSYGCFLEESRVNYGENGGHFYQYYNENNKKTLIFCKGNGSVAEIAFTSLLKSAIEKNYNLVVVEYPGYAKNLGADTEKAISDSAKLAWQKFKELHPNVRNNQAVVMGTSLGGHPASKLAEQASKDNDPFAAAVFNDIFINFSDVAEYNASNIAGATTKVAKKLTGRGGKSLLPVGLSGEDVEQQKRISVIASKTAVALVKSSKLDNTDALQKVNDDNRTNVIYISSDADKVIPHASRTEFLSPGVIQQHAQARLVEEYIHDTTKPQPGILSLIGFTLEKGNIPLITIKNGDHCSFPIGAIFEILEASKAVKVTNETRSISNSTKQEVEIDEKANKSRLQEILQDNITYEFGNFLRLVESQQNRSQTGRRNSLFSKKNNSITVNEIIEEVVKQAPINHDFLIIALHSSHCKWDDLESRTRDEIKGIVAEDVRKYKKYPQDRYLALAETIAITLKHPEVIEDEAVLAKIELGATRGSITNTVTVRVDELDGITTWTNLIANSGVQGKGI